MNYKFSYENSAINHKTDNIFDLPNPSSVLDFSINNNILKTPRNITKALKSLRTDIRPDLKYRKAILNISGHHKIKPENIVIDNGIFSLMNNALKTLKARNAMIVMPCEPIIKQICRLNNCDVTKYIISEKQNFKLDADDIIEKIDSKSDILIISNPSNATGRVISKNNMTNILDYCQSKGIYVIVDETYMDFVFNDMSIINLIDAYHNLVVLRSPSEYYNTSGINSAYAIAPAEITELLSQNILPYQIDVYANAFLEKIYTFDKFDLNTKKWIFDEKKSFLNNLSNIKNVKVIPSDCHIMLIRLEDNLASTVHSRLIKSNILIRDASSFNGVDGSYIRIALKDKKSNLKLIDSLFHCIL